MGCATSAHQPTQADVVSLSQLTSEDLIHWDDIERQRRHQDLKKGTTPQASLSTPSSPDKLPARPAEDRWQNNPDAFKVSNDASLAQSIAVHGADEILVNRGPRNPAFDEQFDANNVRTKSAPPRAVENAEPEGAIAQFLRGLAQFLRAEDTPAAQERQDPHPQQQHPQEPHLHGSRPTSDAPWAPRPPPVVPLPNAAPGARAGRFVQGGRTNSFLEAFNPDDDESYVQVQRSIAPSRTRSRPRAPHERAAEPMYTGQVLQVA